ncbi:MAG TPA: DUF3025 domain-containing protein [Burkholderiales bacterium]|nr:DUF3025 domain-containing protein [Burkholderiales bacterium]
MENRLKEGEERVRSVPADGTRLPIALSATALAHPIFEPVRPALAALLREPGWPDAERLNRLAAGLGAAPRTDRGIPVRFVAPCPGEGTYYEQRVFDSGGVQTRPHNWHDLFNALAWIAFPRSKARINALHAAELPREGGRRGPLRDMLTLFDEGGAIVACADPALAELIRAFRWRELFWERRAHARSRLRFAVLGHAVLEMALAPWPGITCKALIVEVEPALLDAPAAELVGALDARAAQWLGAHATTGTPRALAALPIFGYPGWMPESERADFYDDTRYFRPLRRAQVESAAGVG